MRAYDTVIAALWLLLLLYWMLSAIGVKRNARGTGSWRRELRFRLIQLALLLLAFQVSVFIRARPDLRPYLNNTNLPLGILGAAVCALGVALAIWARALLGRNWGTPMAQKESPDLVTSGPYARVRHPIYTGFLLAMFGAAIGQSLIWLLPFVGFAIYFNYGARREEQVMLAQFPEQYARYMQRTRRFIPWVW